MLDGLVDGEGVSAEGDGEAVAADVSVDSAEALTEAGGREQPVSTSSSPIPMAPTSFR